MNSTQTRMIFAGAFALVALFGAIILQVTEGSCPDWLVAVIFAASGYVFGQAQTNGPLGRRK